MRFRHRIGLLLLCAVTMFSLVSSGSSDAQSLTTSYRDPGVGGYLAPEVVIAGTAFAGDTADISVVVIDDRGRYLQDDTGTFGAGLTELAATTALLPPGFPDNYAWRVPITLGVGDYTGEIINRGSGASPITTPIAFTVVDTTVESFELIATDAEWAYYDAGDAPADDPARWYEAAYDLSAWATGPAELGYGDGDEATETAERDALDDKVLAQYFRHEFEVGDLADFDMVTLSLLRDDGAVVYLNGVELFRDNMPDGVIGYDTPADGTSELVVSHELAASDLALGTNLLAVEVHQVAPGSSDLSFSLSLTAEVSADRVPKESDNTPGTYVLTAGDMARCIFFGDELIAEQMDELFDTDAGVFIGLGDLTYFNGSIREFQDCYDPTIGRHKAVTWPAPGNHEHHTFPNAAGYRFYFGEAAGPDAGPNGGLWYSFDIDDYWHVIALDSDCDGDEVLPGAIDGNGCAVGSEQEAWLRADLEANKDKNILAFFHHPPYTNNHYTDHKLTFPLWRALAEYGADITLHGHEHHYERYGQLDYWGDRDPQYGTREFIIGSGGTYPRYSKKPQDPESDYRGTFPTGTNDFGVLQLWLQPDGYEWRWESIHGLAATDTGSSGLTERMPLGDLTITVEDSESGDPVASIEVCATASRTGVETCGVTDASGEVTLEAIVSDNYKVTSNDLVWVADARADATLTAPSNAAAALTVTAVNSITGHVADATGDPIAAATVCATLIADGSQTCDATAGDGTYRIDGLPTGDYQVEYEATGFVTECWDNTPCSSATTLAIAAGGATGIDAELSPVPGPTPEPTPNPTPSPTPPPDTGRSITGRVTEFGTGDPLFAVRVCAIRTVPAGEWCAWSKLDGSYRIGNLPVGVFAVEAEDTAGRYLPNCAGSQPCSDPERFTVTSTTPVSGVDIRMVPVTGALPFCGGQEVTVELALGESPTAGADVILGTPGPDTINGLGGDDIICAGGGDDVVTGGDGDDKIFGGAGNDQLSGGNDDDTLHGDTGQDRLWGQDGNDRLFGYADADVLSGGDGDDTLHGNRGDDQLFGGPGNDRLFGYADNDDMHGGAGDDRLIGNFGDDLLAGDDGDDYLTGADGLDELHGGNGADRLEGNSGADILIGGPGNDGIDGGIGYDFCHGQADTDTTTRCERQTGIP